MQMVWERGLVERTQGCDLAVNEVVENPEVSGSKLSGDKRYYVILVICLSLGGQSYLVLLLREVASVDLVEVCESWPGQNKMRWGVGVALAYQYVDNNLIMSRYNTTECSWPITISLKIYTLWFCCRYKQKRCESQMLISMPSKFTKYPSPLELLILPSEKRYQQNL